MRMWGEFKSLNDPGGGAKKEWKTGMGRGDRNRV